MNSQKSALRGGLMAATMLTAITGGLACHSNAAASALAADASPSTSAPDGSAGLPDIIVTSRKIAEKAQSAPVTVSVVSGKMIQDLDIDRPEDLARLTPGFHYEETGARYFNKPTIRGLSVDSIEYSNQKAQFFVDGIAFAGEFGAYPTDDGEYDRVEVLKGPQSTAFGRGTLAGGISYITKDPTNDFSGIVSAEGRTNRETHDYAFLNIPLIPDLLTSYVSLNYYNYGGAEGAAFHNAFDGSQLGAESSKDAAIKLKFTPTNWLTFKFRASYGWDSDGLPTFNFLDPSQSNGSFNNGTVMIPVGAVGLSKNQVDDPDSEMKNPGLRRSTYRTEFTAIADLGPVTLTSLTAYNHQNDSINYGAEGSPGLPNYCYTANYYANCPTYSPIPGEVDAYEVPYYDIYDDKQQELRLTSNGDGLLKYTIGFDYFNWDWIENYVAYDGSQDQRTESYSVFGSIGYTLFDKLNLGVEARENYDHITFTTNNYGAGNGSASANFTRLLPRFTADYKFNSNVMVYGVISEGNHPGTFTTNVDATVLTPVPVKEEVLWNYEVGLKSEWYDHRLRINLAAYHEDWSNQQLLEDEINGKTGQPAQVLTNAGQSHIDGVEFEVDAIPVKFLNLRGTFAYDHAVFDKFCSPTYYNITGVQDGGLFCRSAAGKTLAQQPPLTMSILATYDRPLNEEWNYFLSGDWSYIDKKYADETNLAWSPASNIFNFRVGFHNDRIRAELFVENATQESGPVRASIRQDGLLYYAYNSDEVPQKPRQFGMKLTYNFGGPSR